MYTTNTANKINPASLRVQRASDLVLATCLRAREQVKKFEIGADGPLGDSSFRALERHFATLQYVEIGFSCSSTQFLAILECYR